MGPVTVTVPPASTAPRISTAIRPALKSALAFRLPTARPKRGSASRPPVSATRPDSDSSPGRPFRRRSKLSGPSIERVRRNGLAAAASLLPLMAISAVDRSVAAVPVTRAWVLPGPFAVRFTS